MAKLPQYAVTSPDGGFSWFMTEAEAQAWLDTLARFARECKYENARQHYARPRRIVTRAEALAQR